MNNLLGYALMSWIQVLSSSSPQQQLSLRSALSSQQGVNLDILFRYVDSSNVVGFFGSTVIKDYFSMDVRLAWKPIKNIELSLVGQNLLAEHHKEYRQETITSQTEIDRGMYGKLTWKF